VDRALDSGEYDGGGSPRRPYYGAVHACSRVGKGASDRLPRICQGGDEGSLDSCLLEYVSPLCVFEVYIHELISLFRYVVYGQKPE
jgi:hypothetical protein